MSSLLTIIVLKHLYSLPFASLRSYLGWSSFAHLFVVQEFNAKLSDFGLAKAGPTGDQTHVTTQVMGTHGYAAPEYVATGLFFAPSFFCSSSSL